MTSSSRGPEPEHGVLYIVPTPIGNLADLSSRAQHLLANVDLIACEDTRVTRRLLETTALNPGRRLRSLHEHSSDRKVLSLADELEAGASVALVSDAGTPACSDPGFELIREVARRHREIVSVPGPSAALAAVVASGLPTDRFLFVGFLPAKAARRRRSLDDLATQAATVVIYEAPGRVLALLDDLNEVFGDRRVCVSREISKLHEEHLRGSTTEVRAVLASRPRIRGEIVVVVEGSTEDQAGSSLNTGRLVALLGQEGLSPRAIKTIVSEVSGLSKSEVYDMMLNGER